MPKFKSLIVGHEIVVAGKARKCFHNKAKHHLRKGDTLLTVREGMRWKGYCLECAAEMIAEAEAEIEELKRSICGGAG